MYKYKNKLFYVYVRPFILLIKAQRKKRRL